MLLGIIVADRWWSCELGPVGMEGEAEIRLIWIEHKIEDYFQQLSIETAEILSTFIMSFLHGRGKCHAHAYYTFTICHKK